MKKTKNMFLENNLFIIKPNIEKRKEQQNLTHLATVKPKQFWKRIKQQYKKKDQVAHILSIYFLYDHFNYLYGTEINTDNYRYVTTNKRAQSQPMKAWIQ